MTVNYNPRSPYYNTPQVTKYVSYLDFWTPTYITPNVNDVLIKLEKKHEKRPDLLAYELYGSAQLWWVFAARNPDIIKDPIYDFKTNIVIYVPTAANLGNYI